MNSRKEFESVKPGVRTVIGADPSILMKLAGIVVVNCVSLTKVVVRASSSTRVATLPLLS